MSVDLTEFLPEVKSLVRSIAGLPKTVDEIQIRTDKTQRELEEVVKRIQNMRMEPYQTITAYIKRVTSAATVFDPSKPDFTFRNPFDKDVRILAFIIIPEAASKATMILKINVDDIPLFAPASDPPVAADFTDISALEIPLPNNTGRLFKRQKDLKVHLWGAGTKTTTLIWVIGSYFD